VDDDIRNIFAISSILEEHRMKIFYAEDGKQAIQKLKEHNDVDLVLMDIMMPEMDGFETTRRIRMEKEFADLPIIAVTAKAMKGDREKCLEAGASDYMTKPVDTERLISMLRVWLSG
jgi:CheY-like chemotaxis protein